MTRSELIKKIAGRHPDIYIKEADAVVEVIFSEIAQAMVDSRRVEIRGFGAFTVRARKARKARNPRTNEIVALSERSSMYFRAGKELRARLN